MSLLSSPLTLFTSIKVTKKAFEKQMKNACVVTQGEKGDQGLARVIALLHTVAARATICATATHQKAAQEESSYLHVWIQLLAGYGFSRSILVRRMPSDYERRYCACK